MRRILIIALAISLTGICFLKTSAETTAGLSWAAPNSKTLKRVSSVTGAQNAPNFMSNLNCQLITYRLVNQSSMLSGCFTPTAFGQFDSSSQTVIFNGTDEGLPLKSYSPNQSLVPWTSSGSLIALDATSTGGSYISLYRNPLLYLKDEFNSSGQLTAKKLAAAPEPRLKDSKGAPLIINVQTLAISDGGAWLVAETLTGNFVRINLATLDVISFAPAFGSQGSPGLLMSQISVSEDGRTVAIYNNAADSFKVYDLSGCSGFCPNYDYQPFIRSQINNLRSIRQVRFINDRLLSFEATSTFSANDGVFLLSPTESIQSLTDYLAMGDSYTSGEGAFDYIAGTDTEENRCHLSINSYPMLLSRDLFSQASGHSVACSGAEIRDIASESDVYAGQVRNVANLEGLKKQEPQLLESVETNYMPGYVAQNRFLKRWQPKIVTVSVGGNDIGFGEILKQCVIPRVSFINGESDCFSNYEDRREILDSIDRTIPQWTSLYTKLKRQSPISQVYSVGYPELAYENGDCALNVHLSKKEISYSTELIQYLNNAIQKASLEAGIDYIDISKALAGHRLCETVSTNTAVNGLTAGTDKYIFGSESYHPNALGHSLIEKEIMKKTQNLSQISVPVAPTQLPELLNVPKSGRAITNRHYQKITDGVIYRWSTPTINVSGNLLKAFSDYQIRFDGSILGTLKSDEEGNLIGNIPLWSGAPEGIHGIDVTGEGQTDEPISIFQPIYIPRYDYDYDGDDIPNDSDSCLWAINSGKDEDKDGIDDVCDGNIGVKPDVPTSGSISGGNTSMPGSSTPENSANTTTQSSIQPTSTLVTTYSTDNKPGYTNIRSTFASPKTVNPQAVKGVRMASPRSETSLLRNVQKQNPNVISWLWILYLIILVWIMIVILLFLTDKLRSRTSTSILPMYKTV